VEPAGGNGRAQLREEPGGRERRPPDQGVLRRRRQVAQRWGEAWLGEVGHEPAQPRARVREAGVGPGGRERVKQLDDQPRIDLGVRGERPGLPGQPYRRRSVPGEHCGGELPERRGDTAGCGGDRAEGLISSFPE